MKGWICPDCGEGLPNGEACPCGMIEDSYEEGDWDDSPDDD